MGGVVERARKLSDNVKDLIYTVLGAYRVAGSLDFLILYIPRSKIL